jgi:hypothetical protein
MGPTVRSATGPEILAAGSTGTVTPIVGPPLAYRLDAVAVSETVVS